MDKDEGGSESPAHHKVIPVPMSAQSIDKRAVVGWTFLTVFLWWLEGEQQEGKDPIFPLHANC